MQIFIRPLDTQFHRSGLPFDAGKDTEVDSFFPPYPRTLYGALRAAGILCSGGCLDFKAFAPGNEQVFGNRTQFGSLRLLGPVPARLIDKDKPRYDPYLPIPLDLVAAKKGGRRGCLRLLSPGKKPGAGRDHDPSRLQPALHWICPPDDEEIQWLSGKCLLPIEHLESYLLHNNAFFQSLELGHLPRPEEVFGSETRTGIGRSVTFTAAESMLYTVRHHRMDDDSRRGGPCGLLACIEDDGGIFADEGLLQLGGDFRAARWTRIHDEQGGSWWKMYEGPVRKHIAATGRFKAFFVTPALFQKGCLPDLEGIVMGKVKADEKPDEATRVTLNISTTKGMVKFVLKAACIGAPRPVGGWDVQKKEPKPLRRAVPEGSVYFFEADGEWEKLPPENREAAVAAVLDRCHFKSWCRLEPWPGGTEQGPGKEGFGIALIGGW